jgi:hypothetical protein
VSRASFELVLADGFVCPVVKPTPESRLRARYDSYDKLARAVHLENSTVDVRLRLVLSKFDLVSIS